MEANTNQLKLLSLPLSFLLLRQDLQSAHDCEELEHRFVLQTIGNKQLGLYNVIIINSGSSSSADEDRSAG